MAQSMKEHQGYGRRLEEAFSVGVYDMILIPKGLPVFFAEVKILTGNIFQPRPRQYIELMWLEDVGPHAIPVVIGWRNSTYYFHAPARKIMLSECFMGPLDLSFHDQLVRYYHEMTVK
jgi:hypothetical protein